MMVDQSTRNSVAVEGPSITTPQPVAVAGPYEDDDLCSEMSIFTRPLKLQPGPVATVTLPEQAPIAAPTLVAEVTRLATVDAEQGGLIRITSCGPHTRYHVSRMA